MSKMKVNSTPARLPAGETIPTGEKKDAGPSPGRPGPARPGPLEGRSEPPAAPARTDGSPAGERGALPPARPAPRGEEGKADAAGAKPRPTPARAPHLTPALEFAIG